MNTAEHTPTTEDVRDTYANDYWMVEVQGGCTVEDRAAEFDRWIEAHDREVEAAVVVRIAETVQNLWRKP